MTDFGGRNSEIERVFVGNDAVFIFVIVLVVVVLFWSGLSV